MAEVLDYSSGFPAPAAIKTDGYVGVVRYIGTPGRGKNLTRGEATQLTQAGIPISLVFEGGASWMLDGMPAGIRAANAAVADAANCGVGVRCVYFACDFDVVTDDQMTAVQNCLIGAGGVLGLARTGVYGEADVIDACLGSRRATFGWQTKAWSGGRVSERAHLLQQIGYVYPGGVQCDHSTVLKPDWGQWPEGEDAILDADLSARLDKLEADLTTLINHDIGEVISGDAGHKDTLKQLRSEVAGLGADLDALPATLTNALLPALDQAVQNALTSKLVQVDISVHGTDVPS